MTAQSFFLLTAQSVFAFLKNKVRKERKIEDRDQNWFRLALAESQIGSDEMVQTRMVHRYRFGFMQNRID